VGRRRREDRTIWGRLRRLFVTGLAIIFPLAVTVWLLKILFRMVHGVSTPFILNVLRVVHPRLADDPAFVTYLAPLIGMILTLLLVLLVGALTTNLFGRRLVDGFDRLMLRLPLIKSIYGSARQLLDAFGQKTASFQRVVAVEYPRKGVYTVGFVTRDQAILQPADGSRPMPGFTFVFLPTTPNPTSGWLAVVPDDQLIPLDVGVEDGVKMIVSGGLVVPPGWQAR
jgi:uncharacterized membrane protein